MKLNILLVTLLFIASAFADPTLNFKDSQAFEKTFIQNMQQQASKITIVFQQDIHFDAKENKLDISLKFNKYLQQIKTNGGLLIARPTEEDKDNRGGTPFTFPIVVNNQKTANIQQNNLANNYHATVCHENKKIKKVILSRKPKKVFSCD